MLFFVLLLIGAGVVAGFYGYQNPGSHDVSLFGWHGSLANWIPVAVAAAAVGVVALLAIAYGRARIVALRRANRELREEMAAMRARRSTYAPTAPPPSAETAVVGRAAAGATASRGSAPVPAAPGAGRRAEGADATSGAGQPAAPAAGTAGVPASGRATWR